MTGLVRRGVQVTLVSFGNIPTHSQTEWMDGLRGIDFRPTAFRLEWMQEAEEDIESSREFLMSVITEIKPDVLHLNQFCYGSLPVEIPKIVVAHSDVVSWWAAVKNEIPGDVPWMRWYRGAVWEGLRGATAIVSPSAWMSRQVEHWYGKFSNSSVIYNGRTPALFNPHVTKEGYALSVGRLWDGGKQVSLLARAKTCAPIFILGTEEHADAALRGGKEINLQGPRVELKGPQSEGQLRQWYSRASIYVATSRYEPFGLAPLEAALSRCVILANDIPTFREIWGDAACYFNANDLGSLEHKLDLLHGDRELRLTYANLAYNRARHRYSAARMVDEYANLYQVLMKAGALAA